MSLGAVALIGRPEMPGGFCADRLGGGRLADDLFAVVSIAAGGMLAIIATMFLIG